MQMMVLPRITARRTMGLVNNIECMSLVLHADPLVLHYIDLVSREFPRNQLVEKAQCTYQQSLYLSSPLGVAQFMFFDINGPYL